MKRTILITALFLGLSVVGYSQTTIPEGTVYDADASRFANVDGLDSETEMIEVVVTDKKQVSADKHVYKVKHIPTGLDFESLPTQAQKAIGEHTICELVPVAGSGVKTYLQEKGCTHTEFTFEIIGRSIPENTSE